MGCYCCYYCYCYLRKSSSTSSIDDQQLQLSLSNLKLSLSYYYCAWPLLIREEDSFFCDQTFSLSAADCQFTFYQHIATSKLSSFPKLYMSSAINSPNLPFSPLSSTRSLQASQTALLAMSCLSCCCIQEKRLYDTVQFMVFWWQQYNLNCFWWYLMSSREEEQQVFYEQQQVLWAKIRGYPWWPAFIDKIHPPVRGKETEYTVFFFGDNTQYSSSKLGASKLRKFYENYTEFYQKARAHRKLMASIQMAEEKLKQNDQNVEIFEELRNTLKTVKRPKNSSVERKQSKISEPDPELSAGKEELPDLNKSKTFAHTRGKRNFHPREEEEEMQHSQQESLKNHGNAKKLQTVQSTDKKSKKQQHKKEDASPSVRRKRNSKEEIFEEESQPKEKQKQKVLPVAKAVAEQQPMAEEAQAQKAAEDEESQQAQQSIQEEDAREESSEDIVYEKKLRNSAKRKSQNQRGNIGGPRKRGRPKKKFLRHFNHEDKAEPASRPAVHRLSHLKRKIIHKTKASPKKVETSNTLSEQDSMIISQLRQVLHRREELIDYLGSISITIHNVQEILELGVSNILQEGEKSPKVNELLFVLRNVLLYKYFPDDIKHKKKYEKILKKKPITIKNDEKDNREESQENKEEQEIRKKTIVKLQKFLKAHPDVDSKAKQLAIRIQAFFQQSDSQIGDKYKSLAFKVLSSLKQRRESYSEVMKKLESRAYD